MKYTIIFGLKAWLSAPFSWSKWVDITTFQYAGGYLLQGRVNHVSNAKQFRITELKQSLKIADAPFVTLEKLKEVGL